MGGEHEIGGRNARRIEEVLEGRVKVVGKAGGQAGAGFRDNTAVLAVQELVKGYRRWSDGSRLLLECAGEVDRLAIARAVDGFIEWSGRGEVQHVVVAGVLNSRVRTGRAGWSGGGFATSQRGGREQRANGVTVDAHENPSAEWVSGVDHPKEDARFHAEMRHSLHPLEPGR